MSLSKQLLTLQLGKREVTVIAAAGLVIWPVAYYITSALKWWWNFRKIAKQVDKIPGPPKHPIKGNLHQVCTVVDVYL